MRIRMGLATISVLVLLAGCEDDKTAPQADPAGQGKVPPPSTGAPDTGQAEPGANTATTGSTVTAEDATAAPNGSGDSASDATGGPDPTAAPTGTLALKGPLPQAPLTAEPTTDPPKEEAPDPPEPKAPTGPVVGKPWSVVASAAPDPGYKCNDLYPHRFLTSGGTNVEYPTAKPKGGCAGKGVAVTVPFIPKAAGAGTVAGTFRYGICDDAKTNCVVRKKPMTLAFNAAAE